MMENFGGHGYTGGRGVFKPLTRRDHFFAYFLCYFKTVCTMQIPGQNAITSGQNANTFANPANCENAEEGEREMTGCSAISARMDISQNSISN